MGVHARIGVYSTDDPDNINANMEKKKQTKKYGQPAIFSVETNSRNKNVLRHDKLTKQIMAKQYYGVENASDDFGQ